MNVADIGEMIRVASTWVLPVLLAITLHEAAHGFAAAGIAREPDYEVSNMVTALSMVRAGLGVTVLPRMVLDELNMKGLHAGRINDPRPARIIGIITRIDRPLSPAAAAYVDLLFAAVGRPAYNKHKRQPLPAA